MATCSVVLAVGCGGAGATPADGGDENVLDAGPVDARACRYDESSPRGELRPGDLSPPPSPRVEHTAVWTGREMIVWGGRRIGSDCADDSAAYDPVSAEWRTVATAPLPCVFGHSAVWTGKEMIVWGGASRYGRIDRGARYRPDTDTWSSVSLGGPSARSHHSAVWTGTEMIVWGGAGGGVTGGAYNPVTDTWRPLETDGAPSQRENHVAVWTGTEMLVWGGERGFEALTSGAAYDPARDVWRSMVEDGPVAFSAVWTDTEMVVWGGRYDPALDRWASICSPSEPRSGGTAVWTGTEVIFWGGEPVDSKFSGVVYDPASNESTPTLATVGVVGHSAVWTGTSMVLFGGFDEFGEFPDYTLIYTL